MISRVTEALISAVRITGEGIDSSPTKVPLSELFDPGKHTLFFYNVMFPRAPDEDLPCPSCTQFLDCSKPLTTSSTADSGQRDRRIAPGGPPAFRQGA
jgi:hypothetical protein